MREIKRNRLKNFRIPVFLILVFLRTWGGVNIQVPNYTPFQPLHDYGSEASPLTSGIEIESPFDMRFLKDTTVINFENREITFYTIDTSTNYIVWQYHFDEMEEYFKSSEKGVISSLWSKHVLQGAYDSDRKRDDKDLEFALPVNYPPWARRIFGSEPPKLTISGYQEIEVYYEVFKEGNEVVDLDEDEDRKSNQLGFDFPQRFKITGSIGRLVKLHLEVGSEATDKSIGSQFKDQLKNMKIEYKEDTAGELEDEVIQEVVAGYTNFSMPGQYLSGYSGSHENLLGIRVKSQWGPVSVTNIFSYEKGEAESKVIRPGTESESPSRPDKDYLAYKYFYLDTAYLKGVLSGNTDDLPEINDLEVYVSVSKNTEEDVDETYLDNPSYEDRGDIVEGRRFRKLENNTDYEYDKNRGWIRFENTSTISSKIVGIFMETDTTESGMYVSKGDKSEPHLAVIKNTNTLKDTSDPTFDLMWRNVYSIPSNADPSTFDLMVYRVDDQSGDTLQREEGEEYYAHVMGIADDRGSPLVSQDIYDGLPIFDFEHGTLVIPHWDNDSIGHWPFANPELEKTNINIYSGREDRLETIYRIKTTGTSEKTRYSLGMGVSENTVEATINNGATRLKENVDYRIDYFSGEIELISDLAKNADKINVKYQQESFAMFDKKGFVGMHAKLPLFIGEDSYLAGSIMGQFVSSRDKMPRVGNEVFNRYLFDVNTHFGFRPEWMTAAVNMLPLIDTDAESNFDFDFEIAGSAVQVNDESRGEAYIDNFKSAKREFTLGNEQTMWHRASPPNDYMSDSTELTNIPAWHWYWYTPESDKEKERADQIYRLDSDDTDREYLTTLNMVVDPLPADSGLMEGVTSGDSVEVKPWAGIMRPISDAASDRRDDRYFEFWMKVEDSNTGKIHLDFGQIREDLSLDGKLPNGERDYEKDVVERYDPDYDLGLDTLPDSSETYYFPDLDNGNFIELEEGDPRLGDFSDDPARDNYEPYNVDNRENKKYSNGTQEDGYLTQEDLNDNGFRKDEQFFRATIDISSDSSYLDTANIPNDPESGWRHYKIPLREVGVFDTIGGNPDWKEIEYVRVWYSGMPLSPDPGADNTTEIIFKDMKFTGNKWDVEDDEFDTSEIEMKASTIDSVNYRFRRDDGSYVVFSTPEEMTEILQQEGDHDPKKDQALELEYREVEPGEESEVEKYLYEYQQMNLTNYNSIKMFLFDAAGRFSDAAGDLKFYFRLGNSDSSYYEWSTEEISDRIRSNGTVKDLRGASVTKYAPLWSDVEISMKRFTDLKLSAQEAASFTYDSIMVTDTSENGDVYRVHSKTNELPSMSSIKWLSFGVKSEDGAVDEYSGAIWVNALRTKGLQDKKGMAVRTSIDAGFADFFNMSAEGSYDNADFTSMSDDYGNNNTSKLGTGLNSTLRLNKLIPDKHGFSIPLNANVSASITRPTMAGASDIDLTRNNEPDKFSDIYKDLIDRTTGDRTSLSEDVTPSENYETYNMQKGFGTSYTKAQTSDNIVTKVVAERPSFNYSYANTYSDELRGRKISEGHFFTRTVSDNHNGRLSYDLTPWDSPDWTEWQPFKSSSELNRDLREYKLSLLPSKINFDLINASYGKTNTIEDRYTYNSRETDKSLSLDHGFQFQYSPISPLVTTTYNISVDRDLQDPVNRYNDPASSEFITNEIMARNPEWKDYWILKNETKRSQDFSVKIKPNIFNWITNSADYRSKFAQTPKNRSNDPKLYSSNDLSTTFDLSSRLRFRSLFKSLSEKMDKETGFKNFLEGMNEGFGNFGFEKVEFQYSADSDLRNEYFHPDNLSSHGVGMNEYFAYQLGLKDRDFLDIVRGDYDDKHAFGGVRYRAGDPDSALSENDTRNVTKGFSVSSGFEIPKPINITFDELSFGRDVEYTSRYDRFDFDTTYTVPQIGLTSRLGIIEDIDFIRENTSRFFVKSNYDYEKTETVKRDGENSEKRIEYDKKYTWAPFIEVTGEIRKVPITFSYNYNFSIDTSWRKEKDVSTDETGTPGDKTKEYGNSIELGYKIDPDSDRKIELFRGKWVIPLDGKIDMKLNLSHQKTVRFKDSEKDYETLTLNMNPSIGYSITENIRGEVFYIGELTESENGEKSTLNRFSMKVRIDF